MSKETCDNAILNPAPGLGENKTGVKVTERRVSLLKTGALQSAIINSANFSSIATDAQGVIQIFNVGAERMLGYAASEVLDKITPADISDPLELIARAKALSEELATPIKPGFEALVFKASRGIEDIYELSYIRKDGSLLPAIVSVTALRDAKNTIIGYLLIGTDNTIRKKIEAERLQLLEIQEDTNRRLLRSNVTLRISEERLAVTLNSIGDGMIATDAERRVTLMNPIAEQLTGWKMAQAIGRPVEEIFYVINQETRNPSTIPVGETLAHGTIQGLANHTILIARDGSEYSIADSCAPIRDREGLVIGAVLVFRDITREYATQQALRDNAALIQTILNSVADGIITLNACDGIINTVNPAAGQIFGYASSELCGKNFNLLIAESDRDLIRAAFEKLTTYGAASSDSHEYEFRGRRKNCSIFPMEILISEMRLDGTRYFSSILRDITARKQLDQVLQEKNLELERAKLLAEKASLAKSDSISNMSHELRSPLNAILGFAQLLEAGSPPPTPLQTTRLHQIIKAGWYLLELINEILDLALIESGKLSLSHEPVSLLEVMNECQAMIESQAQKRDIRVIFLPFDPAWFAFADRTRVKQALTNLLTNAIKYNRAQGTVEVKCTEAGPERIRISVKDSGVGLPPEKVAQLFQPFNRLGQENGTEQGTGIGLVVTKRLIELMGGAIGVESIAGVGSEFWIELLRNVTPLPLDGNKALLELAPPAMTIDTQRTVLYVEDNPANLMLVEQIIEGQPNVNMVSTSNGIHGIALARAHLPDVILMDINLPGISGIEVMGILREDPVTRHIPVVAISANAMLRDIEKGLEAGFFRYLTKPIKVNEFMIALNDALQSADTGTGDTSKTGEI
jgi:PAS domain S-box-containing protein